MVAVLLVAGLIIGGVAGLVTGWFLAIRGLPRMIARMAPSELDALADRVGELRDGPS